jgi:pectate lyase
MTTPWSRRTRAITAAAITLGLTLAGVAVPAGSAAAASCPGGVTAFPGAEGFGACATGGRGGSVYHVTTLADSGPGSFRDAVSQPNRTVVFDVGGVITIGERVQVAPNITIAGETAPGDGITVYGNGVSFTGADNAIVRYLRVRQGKSGTSETDAISVSDGDSMIFDHISASWGRDEVLSVTNGSPDGPRNITIQDTIMAQGLETHSAGSLMETAGGISLLRNLYIDNDIRNAKVKGVNQYVNNVVYNWKREAYILGGSAWTSEANVQHSYFITGPSTEVPQPFVRGTATFHLYAARNMIDDNRNGALDGREVQREEYGTVAWEEDPYPYPEVTLLAPEEAYRRVIAKVGASLHRDRVDSILIREVTSLGTRGTLISDETLPPMNGPGPIRGGTPPADGDRDGIPDGYEKRTGTDPGTPDNNGDQNGDGYTNLENYLHSLTR